MNDLKNVPSDVLVEELERRKIMYGNIPKAIENPNLTGLIISCDSLISDVVNGKYHEDGDYKHFIYAEALNAIYGSGIFKWINTYK